MSKSEIWDKFLKLIITKISSISFQTWFKDLKLLDINDDKITLTVPFEAQKNQLINLYLELIEDIFSEIIGFSQTVDIILESESKINLNNDVDNYDVINIDEDVQNKDLNEDYKYYSNFNQKYTFENFIVGDSNRFAYSSALAVAEKPGKLYNPLFLYGKSGLGKTHLMHAIGNYLLQHSNKKVLYITSEQFINEFINLTKDSGNKEDNLNYIELFKSKYRDIDVLMIDDIQFLVGAVKTQQEFTNTFNSLYYDEKQIVICSDRSVDDLKLFEERLKTRFNWGLKAIISVPEFDLKVKIIKNKIKSGDLIIDLDDSIIDFIAANCGSDVRNLEGAITRLHAFSAIMNIKKLSLDDAREALKDYTNNSIYAPNTVEKIQNIVALFFDLSIDDLKGKRKSKVIANARMIAMYLCRTMTEETYPKIGLEFGGRDHSTVIHAYEKINKDLKTNAELDKIIEELKKKICE